MDFFLSARPGPTLADHSAHKRDTWTVIGSEKDANSLWLMELYTRKALNRSSSFFFLPLFLFSIFPFALFLFGVDCLASDSCSVFYSLLLLLSSSGDGNIR